MANKFLDKTGLSTLWAKIKSLCVTINTEQKITGSKAFTGQVGNTQSESGVYLGLDTNTAAPNANIAITSANSAAYIDMGKPNHDYDFRLIKWDSNNGNIAQMCYNTEDGGAYANITIPRASGTLALTSDIPSRVSNNAPARSYIDYIGEENKNSQFQVAFRNNTQDDGICRSKFANMSDSSMTPSECTYNGFFYVVSYKNSLSGANANPFIQYHLSAPDFRILTTAYSSQWLQQIATDLRSEHIYTRRRENGTWSKWVKLATAGPSSGSSSGGGVELGRISVTDDNTKYSIDTSEFSFVEISMVHSDLDGKTLYMQGAPTTVRIEDAISIYIDCVEGKWSYQKNTDAHGGGTYSSDTFTMYMPGQDRSSTINFVYRGYK